MRETIDLSKPKHSRRLILLTLLLFIILIGIIAWNILGRTLTDRFLSGNDGGLRTLVVKQTKKALEPLTGEKIDEAKAGRTPVAVVIENHPEARPQSGLDQASVIYETIAEGGITRFLAIFGPNVPEKLGPVRSARTFFVHWAREYDAPLGHVGGNIDALDLIKETGAKDLDQFRYGLKAYWREPKEGIATEHTMFASMEKLRGIVKQNGWDTGAKFEQMTFKDDAPTKSSTPDTPLSQIITVDFSTPTYQSLWAYRPQTNDYLRTIEGKQYVAKNIIIQTVVREAVTSRNGVNRFEFTLAGSGKAKIVRDGTVVDAIWKKTGANRTKFFDASGAEIAFNRGITWYEIVHPELVVTIK